MNELDLILLAEEIKRTYEEEDRGPFPSADCRELMRDFPFDDHWFATYLDTYCSDIAGHCSWGKGILKWPAEKLRKSHGLLSFSFFDLYPQYANLQRLITDDETPDLFEELKLYDKLRRQLLVLLFELIRLHEEKS